MGRRVQGTNVSAVRSLRVLRPLRTLSLLPAMKHLINTMLAALPMLGNVMLLSMFLFVVFGILGVQVCTPSIPPASSMCVYYNARMVTRQAHRC
jgi:hypothetical protein